MENIAQTDTELQPADIEREKSYDGPAISFCKRFIPTTNVRRMMWWAYAAVHRYQLAEDINAQMIQMESTISDMIKSLNTAHARAIDPESPVRPRNPSPHTQRQRGMRPVHVQHPASSGRGDRLELTRVVARCR